MENSFAFESVLRASTNNLWGSHVQVPTEIAHQFKPTEGKKGTRRVVCRLNDTVEYQCGILPYGDGVWVIMVNRELQKKLKLDYGGTVQVRVWADTSEYGLPMPEAFEAVLAQDEAARTHFDALTDGKKRTLLYIVGKPKNPDTQVKYALVVAQHLCIFGGKIDFKKLAEMLKN